MARKSRTLTVNEQTAIAQHCCDFPELGDQEVAAAMGCTAAQVRYARDKADAGELKVRRSQLTDYGRAAAETMRAESDEILEEQIHLALGQLSSSEKMPVARRVALVGQLVRIKAKLLETQLVKHLKATDAGVIFELVRMFRPGATEQECIELYYEAREKWRIRSST